MGINKIRESYFRPKLMKLYIIINNVKDRRNV